MIRFPCPNCGVQLAAPPEKVGASATCRFCRAPVTVPAEGPVEPPILEPLFDEPSDAAPQPESLFPPAFFEELRRVHDADIDKDPDDCASILAEIFERRRATIRESRLRFLSDLELVYEAEGGKDPDEHIPLLSSRINEWRSHNVQRMREYLSALPEDDPLRCPISLFGTLGLGRVETAHTSALAWLLHPKQDHGLGTCLIEGLLAHLAKSNSLVKVIVQEVLTEQRLVLSGEYLGRIDVFGCGSWTASNGATSNWMLAIEAKVDASEGDRQLERYDDWINAHRGNREVFRVFLTPDGRRPAAKAPDWIPLSFLDLVRVFREPYPQLRDRPGFHFLRFYLTGLLKDVLRWKIPLPAPEACEDPYGVVDYLKTVRSSSQGDRTHDSPG